MNFFDLHTHHIQPLPSPAILSLCMKDGTPPPDATLLAVGIHPWHLSSDDFRSQTQWLDTMVKDDRVVAIGEAGLDRRCGTPLEMQAQAFIHAVHVSEARRLPLIIHCVKATSEIISMKKALSPSQTWIIHGFRGKPELAKTLLQHGFYLSFGERFNEETVKQISYDRLFLETDESCVGIETIYNKVATIRDVSTEELQNQVLRNVLTVFDNAQLTKILCRNLSSQLKAY